MATPIGDITVRFESQDALDEFYSVIRKMISKKDFYICNDSAYLTIGTRN